MPHPGDDLPALFRSLGPDDADFQATTNAAAHDAKQRWPLFKAVSPQKPAQTPPLSAQERQRWSGQEPSGGGGRAPALSLPGLGDKLARSLSKMSVRPVANTAVQKAALEPGPEKSPGIPLLAGARPTLQGTPPQSRQNLFSSTAGADADNQMANTGLGLFGRNAVHSKAIERDAPENAAADHSLKSVFSRLERVEKKVSITGPLDRRSSFLGRLGKR